MASGTSTIARGPALTNADLDATCRRQHVRLVGALGLYCGDRDLAEELCQEALARLVRDWSKFTTTDDAERWVLRVALNLAKSNFRSRATRQRVIQRYAHTFSTTTEHDSADSLAVRAAVATLPDRPRRALILRYYADLTVAEVAELMQCPQGTVKSLTSQAITLLRKAGLEVSDD